MSYDLRLFRVPEGVEAESAYDQFIRREETELANTDEWLKKSLPLSTRAQMQQVADALRTRWSGFVQFEPNSPLPWIELNDEDLQIQVSIYEESVSINIPYFRQSTTEMVDFIKCCIQVCGERCGYMAFDPQLGRVVTADDADRIIQAYRSMDEALPGVRGEIRREKPWWKFWSR